MNSHTIPFAGVAQRRERLAHPGDAVSFTAPRSIEPFAPRVPIDTGPLWIAFLTAAFCTAVLLGSLLAYEVDLVLRGLL